MLFGLVSALGLWLTAEPAEALPEQDAGVRVRASRRVASPVNIGSGIVLPAGYSAWDQEKLRIVLAHEQSHVRQGDFYLQLLAGLYASLFWFSPLGWWLKRTLCELGEAISDRAGLEQAASRSAYAQILLEFAALPRPTLTGVAMARTSHLSRRIERLLNESSFRSAFAAAGRRALAAVLLVPVALFAATALIRVEAASQSAPPVTSQPQDSITGQSTPQQVTEQTPAPAATPAAVPEPAPASEATLPSPGAPATQAVPAPSSPSDLPAPPAPPAPRVLVLPPTPPDPSTRSATVIVDPQNIDPGPYFYFVSDGFNKSLLSGGEPYALVGEPGSPIHYHGPWDGDHTAEIERARKSAHVPFLFFRHEGKSYIVDDPAIVAQVQAMQKTAADQMLALAVQQKEFAVQQRELGKQDKVFVQQQQELAKKMRDLNVPAPDLSNETAVLNSAAKSLQALQGEAINQQDLAKKMRDLNVPTPDLSKEIADLISAAKSLKALQGGTINQQNLADLQRKIGEIQGKLGGLEGKIIAQQLNLDGPLRDFAEQQAQWGNWAHIDADIMGHLTLEDESGIKSILDQSLSNGKARPVK